MSVEEVIQHMRAEEFKPNCAIGAQSDLSSVYRTLSFLTLIVYHAIPVLLDFLIRHGHITPENEPNYIEILTRIHGRFHFERYPEGVNAVTSK